MNTDNDHYNKLKILFPGLTKNQYEVIYSILRPELIAAKSEVNVEAVVIPKIYLRTERGETTDEILEKILLPSVPPIGSFINIPEQSNIGQKLVKSLQMELMSYPEHANYLPHLIVRGYEYMLNNEGICVEIIVDCFWNT